MVVDINTTMNATMMTLDATLDTSIAVLQPVLSQINHLVQLFQYAVGGVLMLYVIMLYLRWREQRRLLKELQRLDKNIEFICQKLHIVPIRKKRSAIVNIFSVIKSRISKIRKRRQ